ncbi:hypothetical protein [Prevotella sp. tf2-5]|uniref:hypothetical protein n=1 Tax=Prevotella sp. tf2-5 TaxID=1761889 RepID=UPI0008EEB7C3|nr:hypothetical protein [Prevotella sp. tf2-5]SFO62136.1 hypothetical protein SAMN04487852_103298 [Prevotella sp. tf2-5]
MNDSIELYGSVGNYILDGNSFSFQIGEGAQLFDRAPSPMLPSDRLTAYHEHQWLGINGYQVCMRGMNNNLIDEVTAEIKHNRLLPRLYSKEIKMLYGHGHAFYRQVLDGGKIRREYVELPQVREWLDSWEDLGLVSAEEFSKTNIKNFYYFGDFFCKWRFSRGKRVGMGLPVAGLENLENKHCLLATTRQDVAYELISYQDFHHVAVGRWFFGTGGYKIYPKFNMSEVDGYMYAAVSHHREKSVDEFYGVNETHQGARPYIQGSNKTAHYINSFLKNSLAAKVHIIVPNAWISSKREQITRLCQENQKRKAANKDLIKYNGLEIGTEYSESVLIQYLRMELRKVGEYLSGEGNQGKAYSTISFMDAQGHEQQWKIEPVDLKYKEYIDALISYDKRTEQALLSSVGLDAAISAVDKEGVISKSGSDSYYNYLIYIMSLTPEEEICTQPLNMAMRVNFPDLYRKGYRIGFYREVPQRQEDVSPKERLNNQQS